MYSATFIFAKVANDDEFDRLGAEIASAFQAMDRAAGQPKPLNKFRCRHELSLHLWESSPHLTSPRPIVGRLTGFVSTVIAVSSDASKWHHRARIV